MINGEHNAKDITIISSTDLSQNNSAFQLVNKEEHLFHQLKQLSPITKFSHKDKKMSFEQSSQLILQKSFPKNYKEDKDIVKDHYFKNNTIQSRDYEDMNRRLYRTEKILGTDSEDESSDSNKHNPFVILPQNIYKRIWDMAINLIILYSSLAIPYEIAFIDSYQDTWIDTFFDVCLWIDIVLTFFSAYTDNKDKLIKKHKKIVISYATSWFLVDLVSVLPINLLTANSFQYNRMTRLPKLYRLIKLTKLLRVTKISSGDHSKKNQTSSYYSKFKIDPKIRKLIFFIIVFLVLNHEFACFWYFMAKVQDMSPDTWVVRLGYVDCSIFESYMHSFYWALTTVTTVGYGDIAAGNTLERVYSALIMSFGVLLYSFTIGSLSSIVATLDQKTAKMNHKLKILALIREKYNIDKDVYEKVRKVIRYDLNKHQKERVNFMKDLPFKLRMELSQIMHDKVVQRLIFFKDEPDDFFAYVVPLLIPVKFTQYDYLFKCDDYIDETYFIVKGTVIFCLDKQYSEKEIKEIKKYYNFGEIEMCLNEKLTFNIKIKSRTCEMYILKKNDFLRLSVFYKEFIENFLSKSLIKYLRFTEQKNKMMQEIDEESSYFMNSIISSSDTLEEITEEDQGSLSDIKEQNSSDISIDNSLQKQSKKEEVNNEEQCIDTSLKKTMTDQIKSNYSISPTQTKQIDSIVKSNASIDKHDGKFNHKIDKIITFIEKHINQLPQSNNNPMNILLQLKTEEDILIKNQLIDQIEYIIKSLNNNSPSIES